MVFCTPVAVATGAASAGATAVGLGLSKETVDVTNDNFYMQMRQAKRLFTAGWAEASYHHGEALQQTAQQHSESSAYTREAYYQSEKLQSQNHKLARDQDVRSFEMMFRADIRELLRDELTNQFNRYNIILLTNSVLFTSIYILLAGSPLSETATRFQLTVFLFTLGGAVSLFFVSMWFAVIIVRRLHEHTATTLARKLFADDQELQDAWQQELLNNAPSGHRILHLANSAYCRWLYMYITPLGEYCLNLLIAGVIFMFVCGGVYTHVLYEARDEAHGTNFASIGIYMFWATIVVSITTVLGSKLLEDSQDRRKLNVYDVSYMDAPTTKGPMAKVQHASNELSDADAVRLGSRERSEQYRALEHSLRRYRPDNRVLHEKAEQLRQNEAAARSQMRNAVLKVLTTAEEELDALPEDLIERLNKVILSVSETDEQTAKVVAMPSLLPSSSATQEKSNSSIITSFARQATDDRDTDEDEQDSALTEWLIDHDEEKQQPLSVQPIDAKRFSVSLPSLRSKLGEISLTSTIRIRNLSTEPLRLKSGVQLTEGRYVKTLDVNIVKNKRKSHSVLHHHQRHNNNELSETVKRSRDSSFVGSKVVYHLFPITEIPARTEVVIVSRSKGSNRFRTSGIDGELVYVDKPGTTAFYIAFSNGLITGDSSCNTYVVRDQQPSIATGTARESNEYDKTTKTTNSNWQISHETIAAKNNSEVVVEIFQISPRLVSWSNRRRLKNHRYHNHDQNTNRMDTMHAGQQGQQHSSVTSNNDDVKDTGVIEANGTMETSIVSSATDKNASDDNVSGCSPSASPSSLNPRRNNISTSCNDDVTREAIATTSSPHDVEQMVARPVRTVSWEIDSLNV